MGNFCLCIKVELNFISVRKGTMDKDEKSKYRPQWDFLFDTLNIVSVISSTSLAASSILGNSVCTPTEDLQSNLVTTMKATCESKQAYFLLFIPGFISLIYSGWNCFFYQMWITLYRNGIDRIKKIFENTNQLKDFCSKLTKKDLD